MIGPIAVLHKIEIASSDHHVQECSICHLAHDATTPPAVHTLPAQSPEQHTPIMVVQAGYHLPSSPLARAPPLTA
ncbi:hypothetical protein MD588_15840 [Photobacterium sp. SDRW27]|uniref:hypothetical protein n=1 Tax=Photobacterium obscurum TaxID=2829490 RepID=UPI00224365E5|nr:hypothetical protein [Photobacterium obscurum]MCW8330281.1 hypothetical protein [Photobacterium obscurum]